MINISKLIVFFVGKVELFAKRNPYYSLFIFFSLLFFGPPLLTKIYNIIESFPYIELLLGIISLYKNNFSSVDSLLFILWFFVAAAVVILVINNINSKSITDYFNKGLSKWSMPLKSHWHIQSSEKYDYLGKMLVVTDTSAPGLLKGAFNWYDYEFMFKAMIPNDSTNHNVGFFVRAEDGNNGIFLQVRRDTLVPHYYYEGTYIIDSKRSIKLQSILPLDNWIQFKIKVKGDVVIIKINEEEIYFQIRAYTFFGIKKEDMYRDIDLENLEVQQRKIGEMFDDIKDKDGQIERIKSLEEENKVDPEISDEQRKNRKKVLEDVRKDIQKEREKLSNQIDDIAKSSIRVNLEYHRGSVGFRESGSEVTFFKEVILRRLE